MSRRKRARAKERKRSAAAPTARPKPEAESRRDESRIASARRRVRTVKLGVGAAAVAVVAGSMGLARVSYAGHAKHAIEPLAIPQPLYQVVRKNLLQAGIVAPATAPPDATTSTS
jgi:hypothetical protein